MGRRALTSEEKLERKEQRKVLRKQRRMEQKLRPQTKRMPSHKPSAVADNTQLGQGGLSAHRRNPHRGARPSAHAFVEDIVEVRPSRIPGAGDGLFVTRAVGRGDLLISVNTEHVSSTDAHDGRIMQINDKPVRIGGECGYVNKEVRKHLVKAPSTDLFKSMLKNCEFVAAIGSVHLVATQAIRPDGPGGGECYTTYSRGSRVHLAYLKNQVVV